MIPNTQLQKNIIRKTFLKHRQNINIEERKYLSKKIAENFIILFEKNYNLFINKEFSSYVATRFEADPSYIDFFLNQKNILSSYPQIQDQELILNFIKPNNKNNFISNKSYQQIFEPADGQIVVPDIILVPLVAFDKKLNRLGMGKGFYDATITNLKKNNPNLKTIGIAFSCQLYNQDLPTSYSDSRLDYVVSDSMIFS